jgi:hypothetical protein
MYVLVVFIVCILRHLPLPKPLNRNLSPLEAHLYFNFFTCLPQNGRFNGQGLSALSTLIHFIPEYLFGVSCSF